MFEGYLFEMLRTLLALAGVCLFAWALLRMLARRGFGKAFAVRGALVEVVERVPLDGRRALYVVRVGGRLLLIGLGESGAPTLVLELDSSPAKEGAGTVASEDTPRARASGAGSG